MSLVGGTEIAQMRRRTHARFALQSAFGGGSVTPSCASFREPEEMLPEGAAELIARQGEIRQGEIL
jgi:hypothetical protein